MGHGHSPKPVDMLVRQQVRAKVTCPKCGSPPGWKCVGAKGQVRAASHAERWEAFRKLEDQKT